MQPTYTYRFVHVSNLTEESANELGRQGYALTHLIHGCGETKAVFMQTTMPSWPDVSDTSDAPGKKLVNPAKEMD